MINNFPSHWVTFDMLDIIDYAGGSQPPKKNFIYEPKKGYIRLIQIRDYGEKPFPTYVQESKMLKTTEEDDIMIARYGGSAGDDSLGRICGGIKGAYNVALTKVIYPKTILPGSFIKYLLSGPWLKERLNSLSRSCQSGFNRDDLKELLLPLPPLNEQNRIVEKLDTIIPKAKNAKTRLEKIPVLLKKFRQSVILSAFNGELTSAWRDRQVIDKTGEDLLHLIIKERKVRKRADKLNLQNIILDLPESWAIANIDSISEDVVDCPHSTPKWSKSGKLCLRTNNFLANRLFLEEKRFVSQEIYKKRIIRLKPQKGDILYSREGGILGIACILDIDEDVCLGQRMMLFRLNQNIDNKFICYYMNSSLINTHVNMLISGSAAPHINVGDIKEYPVPIPPLVEQKEIIRRIEKLFALADSLESKYKNAMTRVEKIEQSILAKAFRGELVEADPNDEPAEELLKRILMEKVKLADMKKGNKSISKISKTKDGIQ